MRSGPLLPRLGGLLVLAPALLAACSSTPTEARPQRVAFLDYRQGTHLELVNETHTGRVEQYSEVVTKEQAGRKVQTDEVMQGLLDLLRRQGFEKQARPGPAPRAGNGQNMMALEIDDGGNVEYVLGYKGMPADQRTDVLTMAQTFVELFNQTYGLQAVEVKQGDKIFENPVGPTHKKAPKVPEIPSGGGAASQT